MGAGRGITKPTAEARLVVSSAAPEARKNTVFYVTDNVLWQVHSS